MSAVGISFGAIIKVPHCVRHFSLSRQRDYFMIPGAGGLEFFSKVPHCVRHFSLSRQSDYFMIPEGDGLKL